MAYALRNREVFKAEVNSRKFTFTCYTQSTSYGFRHICTLGFNNTLECKCIKSDIISKATYYNRTWERFTYETVLSSGLRNLLKSKDITKDEYQELHDVLIERKAQKEHEECEASIKAFQALYEKTSDSFKERAKELPLMTSESDVQAVKGLMALDILVHG